MVGNLPTVLDAVGGLRSILGAFMPTRQLDGQLEEFTIPAGTTAGVFRTFDCDGFTHVRFKITSGSGFDLRPRWTEDGQGSPGTSEIINLARQQGLPAVSTMNAQGSYSARSTGRYMQLYVGSTVSNDVTVQVRGCSGPPPVPRSGVFASVIPANAVSGTVQASQTQLVGYDLFNTTSSVRYLRLSGSASGAYIIMIPADGRAAFNLPLGETFGSNMTWAAWTDPAGSSAATAGDVQGRIFHIGG